MPGVRIQHPTERNVTFTLAAAPAAASPGRPYTEPWTCPPPPSGCGSTHLFKTYHLRLDEAGSTIVSKEIAEYLKQIPGQPFRFTNEVANPPAQTIHVPAIRMTARAIAPGTRYGEPTRVSVRR